MTILYAWKTPDLGKPNQTGLCRIAGGREGFRRFVPRQPYFWESIRKKGVHGQNGWTAVAAAAANTSMTTAIISP